MKKLDIQITKAEILSFNVQLKDEEPVVNATIGLFTDGGKKMSEYTIGTEHWDKENRFDLPVTMYGEIVNIMKTLETVVVQHCMTNQRVLGVAKEVEDIPF